MTKTLTEQWREGTLPDGYYYVASKEWGMLIDRYKDQINDCGDEWRGFDNCQGIVDEVLAPVPRYDEYQGLLSDNLALCEAKEINAELVSKTEQLEKKLDIATKALEEINKNYRFTVAQDVVYKALKEMEGVK